MLPEPAVPDVSEPEPVVPVPEPVVLEPVLPGCPVLLPEDWAKANGAAPSIPMRTIFFMNPFITLSRWRPGLRGAARGWREGLGVT